MNRRIFLIFCLLLTVLLLSVSQVRAQQPKKVFRVGVLSTGNPRSHPVWVAFGQSLRHLGYVEGQNLTVEFRNAKGQFDRARSLADELVRLGVDVIVAAGAETTLKAASQATSTIPIVVAAVDYDPVAQGYIASLSRPGGNITGVVFQQVVLTTKRLEFLKETVPGVTRVGVFWDDLSAGQLQAAQTAAQALGVKLVPRKLQQPPYNFTSAFFDIIEGKAEALVVLVSPLMRKPERARIPTLAAKYRLPTIFGQSRYVAVGGLMSYGAKMEDIFRRATYYVDRILQGTQPGELPVEQPTKFELVINLKTAKQLRLMIPPSILYQADKVIK